MPGNTPPGARFVLPGTKKDWKYESEIKKNIPEKYLKIAVWKMIALLN